MRSLTEEYSILRTNAIQRKRFQTDQVYGHLDQDEDTHVRLLRDDYEVEINERNQAPPSFVGQSEALQYQMTRVQDRVNQLDDLHKRHMAQPTLDETEEIEIKDRTKEVTEMFSECHNQLKYIRRSTCHYHGREATLTQNLITFLSGQLQDITSGFRKSQNEYLTRIKNREEKSANLFDIGEEVDPLTAALDRKLNQQTQLMVEDNSIFVEQREREIQNIVKSISDLNIIFKELATMVTEQGTIVDRIDYNIEHTNIKVHDGLEQIKKAAIYQKNDKKMHCILILAVIVMIELIILVFKYR